MFTIKAIEFNKNTQGSIEAPKEFDIDPNSILLAFPVSKDLRIRGLAPITARTGIAFESQEGTKIVYAQADVARDGRWQNGEAPIYKAIQYCAAQGKLSDVELTAQDLIDRRLVLQRNDDGMTQTVRQLPPPKQS